MPLVRRIIVAAAFAGLVVLVGSAGTPPSHTARATATPSRPSPAPSRRRGPQARASPRALGCQPRAPPSPPSGRCRVRWPCGRSALGCPCAVTALPAGPDRRASAYRPTESGVQPDVCGVETVTCSPLKVATVEEAPHVQAVGGGALFAFELPTETQVVSINATALAAAILVPCFRLGPIPGIVGRPY
jgi:hypothetical protein